MKRVKVKGPLSRYGTHPWIFSGNVLDADDAEKGDNVLVFNRRGKFMGSALYNPDSDIVLRFYSRKKEPLGYAEIKERLFIAREKRIKFKGFEEDAYRVVFGESDMLPGLIVDRYGRGFVLQFSSYGMYRRKKLIVDAIYDLFEPEFIYEKNIKHSAREEGIPEEKGLLFGELPEELIVKINNLSFFVDIEGGQKTGLFLDQKQNWLLMEPFAREKDVLELFSYQGGFTMHLLRGRAKRVYVVDSQKKALDILFKNLKLNGFKEKRLVPFNEDVFKFLDEFSSSQINFDLIIIDPPSFARSRKTREKGLKAYYNLVDMALKYLKSRGQIAVFSCSSYIKREDLLDVLKNVFDANGRTFRLIKEFTQDYDHPELLSFPESRYLNGFLMEEWL